MHTLRRLALALALALAATAAPPPARATILFARTLDELAREADAVVVATPGERRAQWVSGRIYTDVTVTVGATLAGSVPAGSRLTVRLPGGVVGDIGQTVAGAASLEPGAVQVLFLGPARAGVRVVVSMAAGALPTALDASGEVRVLPARTEGITFVHAAAASPRLTVPASGMALRDFAARLREVVR